MPDFLSGTIVAAGAKTTTQTGADIPSHGCPGVMIFWTSTAMGTGSVTPKIQGKDPVSGEYYDILTGAAITTDITRIFKVHPLWTAAANLTAQDAIPAIFRVVCTANNANAANYSVGYCLVRP